MKKSKVLILSCILFLPCICTVAQNVKVLSVEQVTQGDKNHFFGYYGMNVWNADKTKILALEVDFNDRLPKPGEKAVIGLVDLKTRKFTPVTATSAWNLQQGCMLFWNPLNPNDEFYHNDIIDGKLVSVRHCISTGKKEIIPYAISGMTNDGRYALAMNYGRISRLRKVVSYSGTVDPNPTVAHPDNDGVFVVDLKTSQARLLVSYKQMADQIKKTVPEIEDRHLWTEHAVFSPSGNKVLFLPRSASDNPDGGNLETGLFTIRADGTDMKEVIPYGGSVSHFGWRDDHYIAVTYKYDGKSRRHVLVNDLGKPFVPVGEFKWDGHCSFDRTGKWLLTDGDKNSEKMQNTVWMYHFETGKTFRVNDFDMLYKRYLSGDARCDLHPRISNDNTMICADAVDPKTGLRQMFIIHIRIE